MKSFGTRRTLYAAVTKDECNAADGRFGAACYTGFRMQTALDKLRLPSGVRVVTDM